MGFTNNKSGKNKNQVVLSMVSKATGKTASWVNLTDTFSRTVCGCEMKEVTEALLIAKGVPAMYESTLLSLHIIDATKPLIAIEPEQF